MDYVKLTIYEISAQLMFQILIILKRPLFFPDKAEVGPLFFISLYLFALYVRLLFQIILISTLLQKLNIVCTPII